MYTKLPRKKVEPIKVIKRYQADDGSHQEMTFMIRRNKVLKALYWLKKYNFIYREYVTIDESNLDWMENDNKQELDVSLEENIDSNDHQNLSTGVNERGHVE